MGSFREKFDRRRAEIAAEREMHQQRYAAARAAGVEPLADWIRSIERHPAVQDFLQIMREHGNPGAHEHSYVVRKTSRRGKEREIWEYTRGWTFARDGWDPDRMSNVWLSIDGRVFIGPHGIEQYLGDPIATPRAISFYVGDTLEAALEHLVEHKIFLGFG